MGNPLRVVTTPWMFYIQIAILVTSHVRRGYGSTTSWCLTCVRTMSLVRQTVTTDVRTCCFTVVWRAGVQGVREFVISYAVYFYRTYYAWMGVGMHSIIEIGILLYDIRKRTKESTEAIARTQHFFLAWRARYLK